MFRFTLDSGWGSKAIYLPLKNIVAFVYPRARTTAVVGPLMPHEAFVMEMEDTDEYQEEERSEDDSEPPDGYTKTLR